MFKITTHSCPICSKPTPHQERYPLAVCSNCFNKASDKPNGMASLRTGRKLSFFNLDLGGGYRAVVEETGEEYDSHVCYIDEVKCRADEARFGGIIIQFV